MNLVNIYLMNSTMKSITEECEKNRNNLIQGNGSSFLNKMAGRLDDIVSDHEAEEEFSDLMHHGKIIVRLTKALAAEARNIAELQALEEAPEIIEEVQGRIITARELLRKV
jgi:hypothetical protein